MAKVSTPLNFAQSRSNSWSSSDSVGLPYPLAPSREVAGESQPTKKKRNRKHNSCEPCRVKKVKCDRQVICANCRLHRKECFYLNTQPLPPSHVAQTVADELAAAHAEIARLRHLVDELTHSTTAAHPQLQLAAPSAEYTFPPSSLTLDSSPGSDFSPSSRRSSFSSDRLNSPDPGYIPTSFPLTLPLPSTPSSLVVPSSSVEHGSAGEEKIDLKGINLELEMALEGLEMDNALFEKGGWSGHVQGTREGGREWWDELGGGLCLAEDDFREY